MNDLDIDNMPAGREMDAMVCDLLDISYEPPCSKYHRVDEAEYDDGWTGWCYTCGKNISEVESEPRRVSTDIAAAWLVVEKIPIPFYLERERPGDYWIAVIDDERCFVATAPADLNGLPLAICRAALKAAKDRR